MDKYILLLFFYFVTSVDSLPFNENDIKLRTLIAESTCNFPPMFLAKDEEYASQFRACSADQSNDVLKQMCFELEKESLCYLTPRSASSRVPVVLPTSNITRSLFSGKDKRDYVTQLCQYMTTLPWKSEECFKECSGDAFFICDLYVAMDKVLRSFFEQEAQDYTHVDVFVHSGELGFLYPYPPIGALHNKALLMDCATPSQDTGLIQLCKVMAEVAVKFVKNRVKATFHARQVTENVTANWDPCSRMSTFAAFSTSQEFTQLQLGCPKLCNAHMGICKLIYLGIESYQNLAGQHEKLVQELLVQEVPDVRSEVDTVQEVFEGDNLIDSNNNTLSYVTRGEKTQNKPKKTNISAKRRHEDKEDELYLLEKKKVQAEINQIEQKTEHDKELFLLQKKILEKQINQL